jgi:hypothetical protein
MFQDLRFGLRMLLKNPGLRQARSSSDRRARGNALARCG